MIKDRLKNAKIYYNLSENLKKGFEWLLNTDLETIPEGKYEINGDLIYAGVQEYETKDSAKYESHRKYIDIQYVVQGQEFIGVTDLDNCKTCIPYDAKKDLEFYDSTTEDDYQQLSKGEFLVLFPTDAHKPSMSPNKKERVKKIVVKVAVSE